MRRKTIVAAIVCTAVLGGGLAAHATQYGESTQLYIIDFAWKKSDGKTNVFQTFTTPQGRVVPYEPMTVSSTCMELGANSINDTDQILWIQQDNGTWIALADDTSGLNPHAVLYAATGSDVIQARISDYFNATPRGELQVRTRFVEPFYFTPNYEQRCDEWAAARGLPYAKKKNGKLTIVKRQGP